MEPKFEKINRVVVPELDQMLGQPIRVLDDGFVRVIDYMGSDTAIVQAARVSYGAGTKKVNEDKALIRYLMRHEHTTPFEMCEIKLHIRAPMDCWRQWIRHRTANVNEYSTRYSLAINSFQKTQPGEWRAQSAENRQGSSGTISDDAGKNLTDEETELHNTLRRVYEQRIALGIAREQARKDLPLSTYTEAYWKIDLHNLFHFLKLRMDAHAQLEIRSYATVIGEEVVRKWCPIAWDAFVDYQLNSARFSDKELKMLVYIQSGQDVERIREKLLNEGFFLNRDVRKPSRELKELEEKMAKYKFVIPWK